MGIPDARTKDANLSCLAGPDARDAGAAMLGRMLGSADLLGQVADRFYLERCYYHLYPELVLGGKPDPFWPDISLKTQRVMEACGESARTGGWPGEPEGVDSIN